MKAIIETNIRTRKTLTSSENNFTVMQLLKSVKNNTWATSRYIISLYLYHDIIPYNDQNSASQKTSVSSFFLSYLTK